MKKILLTGGGTAGHVTPNLALLPELLKEGYVVEYAGGFYGIEKEIVEKTGIPYHGISSGKLRRYISFKNVTDIFNVLKGVGDAASLVKKIKPDVIFSKGGFVSVPIVIAGWLNSVPVIVHESDMTPGLANKLSLPFAKAACATFPETINNLPKKKAVLTGSPIRKELFSGSRLRGLEFCGFGKDKPVILVMGGSLGSVFINNALRKSLDELLKDFNIIHLCGKNNVNRSFDRPGYVQFEFVSKEISDFIAMADVVVSRAGSNSICEFLGLQKPNILIPLSKKVSRGDQILNAASFENQGFSVVLQEEELTDLSLQKAVKELYQNRNKYIAAMKGSRLSDGVAAVIRVIKEHTK